MDALLLSGRLVDTDGGARHRYILIRDRRIAWVGVSRPPAALAHGAREIVTGPRTWIFPGLLNLHTHATYNVLPLWHSRKAPFNNRFEWRADPDYKAEISARLSSLRGVTDADATIAIVSELQAIAGGTTVLDRATRVEANDLAAPTIVLCRDIGNPSEIGLPAARRVDSIVDYFKPDAAGNPTPTTESNGTTRIDNYAAARDAGHLGAVLVHLAEGRTGFGSNRGVDPYSRREFEALMQHPSMRDAARVRAVPFNLVHGCGVDVHNPAHVEFLRDRRISLIWSPVSNLLLYGDTLDAERLRMEGINVALGSDWSPSGSKHVWDEAKFARRYLAADRLDAQRRRHLPHGHRQRRAMSRRPGRPRRTTLAASNRARSPTCSSSKARSTATARSKSSSPPKTATCSRRSSTARRSTDAARSSNSSDCRCRICRSAKARRPPTRPYTLPIRSPCRSRTAIDRVEDHLKSLDPPVFRSNLLASSDKAYQRRMQRLRSQAESFGWSARQTMKLMAKGQPPMNGRVPVPPAAVRVWCGFMAATIATASSITSARSSFPPPCSCYASSVSPPTSPPSSSTSTRRTTRRRRIRRPSRSRSTIAGHLHAIEGLVGGRVHDLLHTSVFRHDAQGSWSAFPAARPPDARRAWRITCSMRRSTGMTA